jgi:nucleoside-diphosphate-sugar epimerase
MAGLERDVRVLVTGAAGMIGANLVRRLLEDGASVWAMVRPGGDRSRLEDLPALRLVEADVRDAEAVRAAVDAAQPAVVFHLASTLWARGATPSTHVAVNIGGTSNVLEAIRGRTGVRLVFTGSSSAYGAGRDLREDQPLQPSTVYGASKAAASLMVSAYARLHGLLTVELRVFMPYGPWEHPDRLIPHAILSALEGQPVRMTHGRQERDLVYMDDVVEALVQAGRQPVAPGTVLEIGSGRGVAVREVVDLILVLMERPVELLAGALPSRPDELMQLSADVHAAQVRLLWRPRVSLEDGLRRTIAWFTNHRAWVDRLRESSGVMSGVAAGR